MPIPEKYFYTVLFLDDYYPERRSSSTASENLRVETPILKTFEIKKDTNTENIKWMKDGDDLCLFVRHMLPLPITLEMWNAEGKPIFYCPLLKKGIDSISVGQIVIEDNFSLKLYFDGEVAPPEEDETFKLSLKTLPSFDTTSDRLVKDVNTVSKALDEIIDVDKCGLAIIFRRNSLDSHFDLECEFDESYLHSLAEANDLKYLTRMSKFRDVKWLTKYTDNLQSVLELINTDAYEVRFSWKENGSQWWHHNDPFGYQHQRGHLDPCHNHHHCCW